MKIGFIGLGNMAGAILSGMLKSGKFANDELYGIDRSPEVTKALADRIGIRADGSTNRIVWRTNTTSRHGIENLRFGNVTTTLIREGNTITIESTAPYVLIVNGEKYSIGKGVSQVELTDK